VYRFKVGQHFLLERLSKASGGPALPGGATGAAATLAGSEGANNTSEALESAASLSGVVTDQLVKIGMERMLFWFLYVQYFENAEMLEISFFRPFSTLCAFWLS